MAAGTFRGLRTRAQLGLRSPRSISRNISPGGSNGGVTIHYGGPKVGITASTRHSACERRWKAWQDFHMGRERGWSDIAYTGAFCQHGYAFAGRGVGVRTAGQGTNTGNLKSYAVVFIGGEGDIPTDDALAAMDWWIATLRKSGAGNRVWGHWEWKPTSCPGRPLFNEAKKRDRKTIGAPAKGSPTSTPTSTSSGSLRQRSKPVAVAGKFNADLVTLWQRYLVQAGGASIGIDGQLGPRTISAWQAYMAQKLGIKGLGKADGIAGPATARATEQALGLPATTVAGFYPGIARGLARALNTWVTTGKEIR